MQYINIFECKLSETQGNIFCKLKKENKGKGFSVNVRDQLLRICLKILAWVPKRQKHSLRISEWLALMSCIVNGNTQ